MKELENIENFIEEEIEKGLFTSTGIEHTFNDDFDILADRVESPLIKEENTIKGKKNK